MEDGFHVGEIGFEQGCQCSACVERRVGELVHQCLALEQGVLRMQALLDSGQGSLACQLLQAMVVEVEKFNLSGKIAAIALANEASDAAAARANNRLN